MPTYSDPNTNLAGMVKASRTSLNPGVYLALLAGVLSFAYVGLLYYQVNTTTAQADTIRDQATAARGQLQELEPIAEQLNVFNTQAETLKILFDAQRPWDVVLERVQSRLYKGMVVTGLSVSEQGDAVVISVSGTVSTFAEYAKVQAALATPESKTYFSKVREQSLQRTRELNIEKVTFTLLLTATPALLAQPVDTSPVSTK